jgi:hypothetical protein
VGRLFFFSFGRLYFFLRLVCHLSSPFRNVAQFYHIRLGNFLRDT